MFDCRCRQHGNEIKLTTCPDYSAGIESRRSKIPMKAYLITSGTIFGSIVVAHICRMFAEGRHVAMDPWFLLLTALAAALSVWAFSLLKRLPRS